MLEAIHSCPHCGGQVLAADVRGRSCGFMDRALARHLRCACVGAALLDDEAGQEAPVWPAFEPPLAALIRARQADRAIQLVVSGEAQLAASLDFRLRHGTTVLHLAAAADLEPLVSALLDKGAQVTTTQDDPHANIPGGRTPLHAASAAGAVASARLLLERLDRRAARATDAEGSTPAELAAAAGHKELAAELAAAAAAAGAPDETIAEEAAGGVCDLAGELEGEQRNYARRSELRCRRRANLCIDSRPHLHRVHVLRAMWSGSECDWLLRELTDGAARDGWQLKRHLHHSTFDYPVWRAARAHAFVRRALAEAILPAMSQLFCIPLPTLSHRETFLVRYSQQTQPSLGMHRDGTLLSCNVLLAEPADFDGGGTCFAWPLAVQHHELDRPSDGGPCALRGAGSQTGLWSVGGERGDCVMHSGQIPHGGGEVTEGERYLLVFFVDELVSHAEEGSPPAARADPQPRAEADAEVTQRRVRAGSTVSFGSLDIPSVAAPERRSRYRDTPLRRISS